MDLDGVKGWIVKECFKDSRGHPGGPGLMFQRGDKEFPEGVEWDTTVYFALQSLIHDRAIVGAFDHYVPGAPTPDICKGVKLERAKFLQLMKDSR